MRLLSLLLVACSGSSTPEPPPETTTKRAQISKPEPMRAPAVAPASSQVEIDLASADPMAIVAQKGPGGTPAPAVSLVFASRGDGEIEPCG